MRKATERKETHAEWLARNAQSTGRVVRRETNFATKDEIAEEKRRQWREDDDIRRSRMCRLS